MAQNEQDVGVDLYTDATLSQIVRKLVTFEEVDDTLAALLLQVLAKSSQFGENLLQNGE